MEIINGRKEFFKIFNYIIEKNYSYAEVSVIINKYGRQILNKQINYILGIKKTKQFKEHINKISILIWNDFLKFTDWFEQEHKKQLLK